MKIFLITSGQFSRVSYTNRVSLFKKILFYYNRPSATQGFNDKCYCYSGYHISLLLCVKLCPRVMWT